MKKMFAVHAPLATAAILAVFQILNLNAASETPSIPELQEPGALLFIELITLLATFVLIIRQMLNAYDHKLWIILASVFFLLCLIGGRWDALGTGLDVYEKVALSLYAIAFAAPYLRIRKIAMVTIFLTPAFSQAQSTIGAYGQYSSTSYGPRIVGQVYKSLENVTSITIGEFMFSLPKMQLHEALLMTGATRETRSGELGGVVGIFVEPTGIHETEKNYEGPIALGFGAMAVYSWEKKVLHIHAEVGPGWSTHASIAEPIVIFDGQINTVFRPWSMGVRAHYELGYGIMLGRELGERWQVNSSAFIQPDHTPTYLAGIAYRFGDTHH